MADSIIVIKKLVKRYDDVVALDLVNLNVDSGAVLGLLGPNGAGKTTLVAVLNGLTDFQEGEIEVFGLPLRDNLQEIRSRCTFIPQSLALYETLTVLENLRFFAGILQLDKKSLKRNLDYAIALNRLSSLLDKKAIKLSGGQKQRLNIAIGLLNNPQLLYFDEPTVGIDPELRNDILASISALADEGKTIVYTSHYLTEIEKICDHVAIIHHGKIIRQGLLATLLAGETSNSAVVKFIQPAADKDLSRIERLHSVERMDKTTLLVRPASSANIAALLTIFEQENVTVKTICYGAASLESLFLRITSRGRADV